eukprot:754037-Hanusia_phi.AAC.8
MPLTQSYHPLARDVLFFCHLVRSAIAFLTAVGCIILVCAVLAHLALQAEVVVDVGGHDQKHSSRFKYYIKTAEPCFAFCTFYCWHFEVTDVDDVLHDVCGEGEGDLHPDAEGREEQGYPPEAVDLAAAKAVAGAGPPLPLPCEVAAIDAGELDPYRAKAAAGA